MNAFPLAVFSIVLAAAAAPAAAQDLPKRKPGLWELTMQMQGMPGGGMKSQQCIDEKTDAEMQRKALSGDDKMKCTQTSMKRNTGGFEMESECTSAEGKAFVKAKANGNFDSRYTVDTQMRFEPPRHGMQAMQMSVTATFSGACPAGFAPGQMRMGGMTMNPGQAAPTTQPGAIDPNALKGMSPEQMRKMLEDMKKAAGK